MTYLDIFAQTNFGRFGVKRGDIDVVSGTTVLSPSAAGAPTNYHLKSLRVRAGATLEVFQNLGASVGGFPAIVFVEGDVLIEGDMYPVHSPHIPTGALNWDNAGDGGLGSDLAVGAAGAPTDGTPTLHDILFNGHYNALTTDYRYLQLFRGWHNAGYGGLGFQNPVQIAQSEVGIAGGGLIIIARGKITIASTGHVHADGQDGQDGVTDGGDAACAGHGGGAAGILGLISWTEIEIEVGGLATANGGDGGDGVVSGGKDGGQLATGGGGGGGGLVFTIAARLLIAFFAVQVNGGSPGLLAAGAGILLAFGGGGGGSFGEGGPGDGFGKTGQLVSHPKTSGASQRGQNQWVNV